MAASKQPPARDVLPRLEQALAGLERAKSATSEALARLMGTAALQGEGEDRFSDPLGQALAEATLRHEQGLLLADRQQDLAGARTAFEVALRMIETSPNAHDPLLTELQGRIRSDLARLAKP